MSNSQAALKALFKDAMDWGRSYGQRLNLSDITVDDVSEQFAEKAIAALAKQQASPDAQADLRCLQAWRRAAMESGDWLPDADGMPRYSASKLRAPQCEQAAAALDDVFKATAANGETCHFGTERGATIWAGTSGKVERIALRNLSLVAPIAQGTPPAAGVGEQATGEHPPSRHCACAECVRYFDEDCQGRATKPAQAAPMSDELMWKLLDDVASSIDAPSIVMTHWPRVFRAAERAILAEAGIKEKT